MLADVRRNVGSFGFADLLSDNRRHVQRLFENMHRGNYP